MSVDWQVAALLDAASIDGVKELHAGAGVFAYLEKMLPITAALSPKKGMVSILGVPILKDVNMEETDVDVVYIDGRREQLIQMTSLPAAAQKKPTDTRS